MFSVPAYSQYADVTAHGWKCRSCGPVSVGMVLSYYKKNYGSLDELIRHGDRMGAHNFEVGWYHKGLARLAEQYGMHAAAYDWYALSSAEAFKKLLPFMEHGPVIVSVHKYFNPRNGGHLLVVKGYDGTHVHYNEPAARDGSLRERKVTYEKFLTGWKRRAIHISL